MHSDLGLVGEAEDGEQGIEMISKLRPDLVFLDIQMPGCNGLEVAASLPIPNPKVVFCTAFDNYAVKAFELHAVDYLLKPVSRTRLAATINRIRGASSEERAVGVNSLIRSQTNMKRRFLARHGAHFRVISEDQISYFSIEEGMTTLYAGGQRCWIDYSLADLERSLDPAEFVRISRDVLVRVDHVSEVWSGLSGRSEIVLKTGEKFRVSRRRVKDLMVMLGSANENDNSLTSATARMAVDKTTV
jgi:two-component system LytT family response regulator